jgi:hypothetical protein
VCCEAPDAREFGNTVDDSLQQATILSLIDRYHFTIFNYFKRSDGKLYPEFGDELAKILNQPPPSTQFSAIPIPSRDLLDCSVADLVIKL